MPINKSEYMKEWHRNHPDYAKKRGYKYQKKWIRNNWEKKLAAQTGRRNNKDKSCEVCESDKNIHGHHPDYAFPKEIVFLCAKHHRHLHLIVPIEKILQYNTGEKIKNLLQ